MWEAWCCVGQVLELKQLEMWQSMDTIACSTQVPCNVYLKT